MECPGFLQYLQVMEDFGWLKEFLEKKFYLDTPTWNEADPVENWEELETCLCFSSDSRML